MANVIGPDVSFYQDDPQTPQGINFVKMAATAGYVIIRAGQNLWVDPDFRLNWSEAKRAGLPRGSYWFYDSRAEPKQQAQLWVNQFGGDFGELPLFADFEESYGGIYKGWRNWYTFLEHLRTLVGSKEIGIYTAYYYWRDNAPSATVQASNLEYFHRYPLWIANYGVNQPLIPKPWRSTEWLFWQFTETGDGNLYGVESLGIDLNYFNGDLPTFKRRFNIPETPPDGGTPTGRMYRVTASALHVREGPGTDFNSLGLLQMDEIVEEIGATTDRSWLRVRRADGTLSGWCFSAYLESVGAPPPPPPPPPPDGGTPTGRMYRVTASALNVREGPGTNYNSRGLLLLNEIVEEIGATTDRTWLRVRRADGSLSGWSYASYLEALVTPPPPPPPPPDGGIPTGRMYRVTASALKVREGPGLTFNAIGLLLLNQVVEEIGATPDRSWLRIRRASDGLNGWSFGAYLQSVGTPPPPPPPPTPVPEEEFRNWYRIKVDTAQIRENPVPGARILGTFALDDSVGAVDDTSNATWIKIRRIDGLLGWCEKRFVTLRGPTRPSSYRQRLYAGVFYTRKDLTTPRKIVVHFMGIDLQAEGLDFLVTPPDIQNAILCTRTTSQFLREFRPRIAINGDGFSYVDTTVDPPPPCTQGDPVIPNGYAMSRGVVYSARRTADPVVYFNTRNQVSFNQPKGTVRNAVSGDRMVVIDGKPVANLAASTPSPRTAIGLHKTGRWLTLMVVDGRQEGYSEGVTFPELAELMIAQGIYTGANMDGGGSSTMVVRGFDGQPRVINSPIDELVVGKERAVANHLGVLLNTG